MKKRILKKVDLDVICGRVVEFFKRKGFLVDVNRFRNEIRFLVFVPKAKGRKTITLKIVQDDGDTYIDFVSPVSNLLVFFGSVFRLFGGGFFERLALEDKIFFDEIEREFWVFIEENF